MITAPGEVEPAFLPRHFLIYADLGRMSPDWKRRALGPLRDFVVRLGPHELGRVVIFDGR